MFQGCVPVSGRSYIEKLCPVARLLFFTMTLLVWAMALLLQMHSGVQLLKKLALEDKVWLLFLFIAIVLVLILTLALFLTLLLPCSSDQFLDTL